MPTPRVAVAAPGSEPVEAALSVAALATVVSLLTSLATPDFTSGAPADEYQGKHEAPDPRHRVAD